MIEIVNQQIKPEEYCPIDRTFLETEELSYVLDHTGVPAFLIHREELIRRGKEILQFPVPESVHYIPVNRCADPEILRLLAELGFGARCESPEELRQAISCGVPGERILYHTMVLSEELGVLLREMDAVAMLGGSGPLPDCLPRKVDLICCAPKYRDLHLAPLSMHRAMIGMTTSEIEEILPLMTKRGCTSLGLALHSDSNVTDLAYLPAKLELLLKLSEELQEAELPIQRLNIGSGLGLQYHRDQEQIDDEEPRQRLFEQMMERPELEYSFCLWRRVLDPCGIFAAQILGVSACRGPAFFVDAVPSDFVIPGVDRYRHISIPGREIIPGRYVCDVMGNVPSNRGWIGKRRILPLAAPGELILLHDIGGSIAPHTRVPIFLVSDDLSVKLLKRG